MTDKELADLVGEVLGKTVVANLVGFAMWKDSEIVRDWRVAGALMQRCYENEIDVSTHTGVSAHNGKNWIGLTSDDEDWTVSIKDSLPRAIIEACVEALT